MLHERRFFRVNYSERIYLLSGCLTALDIARISFCFLFNADSIVMLRLYLSASEYVWEISFAGFSCTSRRGKGRAVVCIVYTLWSDDEYPCARTLEHFMRFSEYSIPHWNKLAASWQTRFKLLQSITTFIRFTCRCTARHSATRTHTYDFQEAIRNLYTDLFAAVRWAVRILPMHHFARISNARSTTKSTVYKFLLVSEVQTHYFFVPMVGDEIIQRTNLNCDEKEKKKIISLQCDD